MAIAASFTVAVRALAVATACLLFAAGPVLPQPSVKPAAMTQVAGSFPEVRLRKLHLVRPDLIPYPIAYEVYC